MAQSPVTQANTQARIGAGTATFGAPVFDRGMTFKEVGQTGLRQYSGWLREEFLPQLQGRQAARVYREMLDNSATVGALVFAITQSLRKINWRVEPSGDSPEAQAEAEFVESLRNDMSHTWEDFIAEALSMLGYGYAPHEIVYKRRLGRKPPGSLEPSSQFDDGRIGLRKLPIRAQDTLLKWFFGPNGEILGLEQQPYTGGLVDLPIEKLLLFRPTQHKGNPEGRSILRNSYRSWYFMKRFEEEEAIFFERMSGVPVMYVPQELMDAAAAGDGNAMMQVNAYKRLVTNTKIGEQMGLLLPSNTWPNAMGAGSSTRMYEFALVTPTGGRGGGVVADTVIQRHRLDMLMTVLADFVELGHGTRGTQSLAENKVDMFFQAIEGWINSIASVINRYLLPRIWALNGLDLDIMPQLVPDMAQRIDLAALAAYITSLAGAGMMLFPDVDLEDYLRDAAGLPELSDETIAAHEADEAAKAAQATAPPEKLLPGAPGPTGVPGAGPPNKKAPADPSEMVKRLLAAGDARRIARHKA